MPRTERQRGMLRAMGIRVFEGAVEPWVSSTPATPTSASTHSSSSATATATATATTTATAATATSSVPVARAASPGNVATLDWQALRSEVAACRACGLCESRKQTVFGVGHARAHWMIVGEAPGEDEDQQGEPFVGASGQLLDAMLHALGLTRQEAAPEQQVYIANTVKCRPPRNRNPAPEELIRCEPFLLRQIELV